MKSFFKSILFCACVLSLCSWGVWGHTHINHAAVFALPVEMRSFFYNHIDYITEESVGPDLRKHTIYDKSEGPRHYFDMENYGKIDSIPLTMKEAKTKFDSAFLAKNGTLPWYIQEMMTKLTKAFKDKNKEQILFLAGDLGHYLGDANMPLHTSDNSDGQLTNQKGIHAFWESQLPEIFGDNYNFYTGDAKYIDNIQQETWRIIKYTHSLIDSLLKDELAVKEIFNKEKIYQKDSLGNIKKTAWGGWIHSYDYAKAYHDKMNGMVERQIRNSLIDVANYWYTAWVNAGKPDLTNLDDAALTTRNSKALDEDFAAWQQGKLTMMKVKNEF